MSIYPDLIKSRYGNLVGKDWINSLDPDDKTALIQLGLQHAEHGHLGGIARSKSATRDCKGRFVQQGNGLKCATTMQ